MPRVPKESPATGNSTNAYFIHTTDGNFVDNAGRTLLLRGVNLSGASKTPVGKFSHLLAGFWETAENGGESFTGRPLNIEDGSADVHLARLRGWGFNLLRFPVTWESLEHQGPKQYDYDYMDYVVRVLRKCKEYGFKVFIDPHQDTWSRFSGGSGAPFWTLAACGMNPRNFTATQAAILHCEYPLAHKPDPEIFPAMIWSTNYGRLASQTVFTLFFAGRDFAPRCIIDEKNIQDFLQQHFINAMGLLADRIRDAGDLLDECVIGWDSLNEPFEGLCGWQDLNVLPTEQGSTLKKGTSPTPAQSLRLGMGQKQTVDNWTFGSMGPARDGTVTIDPKGYKAWADPETEVVGVHPKWGWKRHPGWKLGTCVWAQHGVWDVESGYILRPDYFKFIPDAVDMYDLDFIAEYWRPHWKAYSSRIRTSHPEAILFVQPPVFARPPQVEAEDLRGRCAYSAHYYDGLTLITRHWNWFNADALGLLRGKYKSTLAAVKIGETAIRKSFQDQLGYLKDDALILGSYPTIIGEIGIPYDMDGKRAYGWTDHGKQKGDYTRQERALDASLNGGDGENALNWTIWGYVPDHCHQWGDGWNLEDLSLWSKDDLQDAGGDSLSLFKMGDESSAVLLNNKKSDDVSREGSVKSVKVAAASSISLATLGLGAGAVYEEIQAQRTVSALAGWHDNPYEFLTDGARAVRAFSRPYPWKVIGKPKEIKFDIKKAEFKLTVLVQSEDKPGSMGVAKGEELATEVYVPLVHYAQDKYLGEKRMGEQVVDAASDKPQTRTSGEASGINNLGSSRNPSTVKLGNLPTDASFSSATTSTSTSTASPTLGGNASSRNRDLVDLEVHVSDGRWAVEGQVLKWWYDVPVDGEEEREYVIEIRRRGSAISSKELESSASWWVDQFCPSDGCQIM